MAHDREPQRVGPVDPAATAVLRELLAAGRRSVASYRAAEDAVADHRVQAALCQLRLDHERHVAELAGLVEGSPAGEVARDGGVPDAAATGLGGAGDATTDAGTDPAGAASDVASPTPDPLGEVVHRAGASESEVLEALRAAEAELHASYQRCVERGGSESVRAMLSRHRREEEAHVAWLHEGTWWRELRPRGA